VESAQGTPGLRSNGYGNPEPESDSNFAIRSLATRPMSAETSDKRAQTGASCENEGTESGSPTVDLELMPLPVHSTQQLMYG